MATKKTSTKKTESKARDKSKAEPKKTEPLPAPPEPEIVGTITAVRANGTTIVSIELAGKIISLTSTEPPTLGLYRKLFRKVAAKLT